jgi:hypothetical protein
MDEWIDHPMRTPFRVTTAIRTPHATPDSSVTLR